MSLRGIVATVGMWALIGFTCWAMAYHPEEVKGFLIVIVGGLLGGCLVMMTRLVYELFR